jgi:beta-glucosidase
MEKLVFPEGFLWGAATAAYQVEGAGSEDGRGPCIWDTFSKVPGKVHEMQDGSVACDQYHRYPEDITLMKSLGFKAYRFSIAWPRIIPDGDGEINPLGVAHYHRLIDALLEAGIEPVPTLYHWDLPQSLQDKGGWANRATSYAFERFAKVCFREYGPKVRRWATLNEPFCSAMLGYLFGVHAPGHTDRDETVRVVHYLNLAHGLAVAAFREGGYPGEIGIVLNPVYPRPATESPEDVRAAEAAKAWSTDVFTRPLFKKEYPSIAINEMGCSFPIADGDMDLIGSRLDFYGINYYYEQMVAYDESDERKFSFVPQWQETTDMGWPIVPFGLQRMLRILNEESGGIPVYITENGMACADLVAGDGRIHDRDRIRYLAQHFQICIKAIEEGIPLKGYFAWSLLDNYEWGNGYSKRFGIIYTDYANGLKRIPKDSAFFMRDVMAGHGEY